MPTQIKICGITSLHEVAFINKMNVDYIGFVFAESKRWVNVGKASELSRALRPDIKKCGVFVDHTVNEINKIAKSVGLDIAQLHRNYTAEMIASIDIPVWYAVNIKDEASVEQANEAAAYENVAGILADSHIEGQSGGTGKTFNWELLDGIDDNVFLILAGGLNADNIERAIATASPDVVDISSGAEIIAGGRRMKSEQKVLELIKKVKI